MINLIGASCQFCLRSQFGLVLKKQRLLSIRDIGKYAVSACYSTQIQPKKALPQPIKRKPQIKLLNAIEEPIVLKEVYDYKKLPKYYLSLSKFRLSGLVVVTAMAGYVLVPTPFMIAPFLALSMGTALTSASANCFNQLIEISYDSQMDRTRNRVLVNNLLSVNHAIGFASACAVAGVSILYLGCNGLVATLGAANLLLYTCVYTPMKRISIANTWIGSIVGAVPPLMGYAVGNAILEPGAFILAGILYAWQFAHFNALSWNLREDYKKAGYKMMSSENPDLCRRTTLRYSLSLIFISTLAPILDVTSWTFAIDSLAPNLYLLYLSWKFYQNPDSASSRKLFRFSLIHLPLLILFLLISKKGAT